MNTPWDFGGQRQKISYNLNKSNRNLSIIFTKLLINSLDSLQLDFKQLISLSFTCNVILNLY